MVDRPDSVGARIGAGGAIVEHDLVAALRGIPDAARGWQSAKREVRCQSCNGISVLDATRQAQNCPFCGSAQLVPYEEAKPAFRPESVLPFQVSVLGTPNPSVTPTNLLFNVVSTPGALYRYWRQARPAAA